VLLGDEMGLGKTCQALLAIPAAVPLDDAVALIVCPAQVKPTWARQVELWRPEILPAIASGRTWYPPPAGMATITNYAILPPIPFPCTRCDHVEARHRKPTCLGVDIVDGARERACSCPRYRPPPVETITPEQAQAAYGIPPASVLILDEVHRCKTPGAARTRRARYLSLAFRGPSGHVWGLSASPILNAPEELMSIQRTIGTFAACFGTPKEFYTLADSLALPLAREQFRARRYRGEIRRTAESVRLELPDVREETRLVPLSVEAAAEIDRALRRVFAAKRAGEEIRAGDLEPDARAERIEQLLWTTPSEEDVAELVADLIERQSWAEVSAELATLRRLLSIAKTAAALELAQECEEAGEPLVVYSAHVQACEALAARPGWASLRDRVRRQETIDKFVGGELLGVAGVIRGSAEGITLCGGKAQARMMAFIDLDWCPEMNRQARRRLKRRGAAIDRPISIYTLQADHVVDRYVQQTLDQKTRLIAAATG
jgi:hypothetical protein